MSTLTVYCGNPDCKSIGLPANGLAPRNWHSVVNPSTGHRAYCCSMGCVSRSLKATK